MTGHLLNVYNRAPVTFTHGEGSWLIADNGDRYLDCVGGIATDALGHCHPKLVAALTEQAGKLWHISNMFRIPGQEELADRLTGASFADLAFFTNSGTEAIEAALKMARRHHSARGNPDRDVIIGFKGSFHGRTYAAINASGNAGYLDGFGPALPGYLQLGLDDWPAIAAAIAAPTTAAVIIEPVQGEGGAREMSEELLRGLRQACSASGVLLIHDEVQSGMGRTGRLFAHQWHKGVEPDIMAVAKALGGGFPVGACLATRDAASGMVPGVHGTTFGGNPLAMAVAIAAFDEIATPDMLAHVREVSAHLRDGLARLQARYPETIAEVRGKGLLIGVKMVVENRAFMKAAREHLLLVAGGGENCIRLLPPLNLSHAEAGIVLERMDETCNAMLTEMAA
ncbi:MAG: acetylornithine transaminase [Sphingomonas bacterium]|uniref:aspartate aminotransferase family protein n=1 Tax=Sphingomonas bacterium TaxID=1895847 RepID=UPI002627C3D8|nr:aspartate aminotransferase family protein [Sphingomonas bacterium]MDB5707331.1 acetylornithine transaminase [Sphingomonas bacterium]